MIGRREQTRHKPHIFLMFTPAGMTSNPRESHLVCPYENLSPKWRQAFHVINPHRTGVHVCEREERKRERETEREREREREKETLYPSGGESYVHMSNHLGQGWNDKERG